MLIWWTLTVCILTPLKNPIGMGVFGYMVGYSVYGYMIYIEAFFTT